MVQVGKQNRSGQSQGGVRPFLFFIALLAVGSLVLLGHKSDSIIVTDGSIDLYLFAAEQGASKAINQKMATVVIMSYSTNRGANIAKILSAYTEMTTSIQTIIFVWNNLSAPPPKIVAELTSKNEGKSSVPIELWMGRENLLTNRYEAPRQVARPDSPILLVDDDVLLSIGLISSMIQEWENCQKNCIVGLDPRYADPKTRRYRLEPPQSERANLAITKTMLVHHRFLALFMADPYLVDLASPPGSGCDDISFSLLVTNYTGLLPSFLPGEIRGTPDTQRPQIFLKSNGTVLGKREDLPEEDGQSSSGNINTWFRKRTACVKLSLDHFGHHLHSILRGNPA